MCIRVHIYIAVMKMTREQALNQLESALDSDFLKALSEPVRVQILKSLIALGPQDIAQLAKPLPQERTVVGRHVKVLTHAGLVRIERQGRHRIVHLIPTAFVERLETMLSNTRQCMAICCPEELS